MSSNVNEVIRAVLNSLFIVLFVFTKRFRTNKKHQKAPKASKAQKAQRRNQAKAQSATSKQK